MTYTPEQRRNIDLARRLSQGYGPRVRKSLLEAMAVESSYRNLNYGDRDSQGVLQQRPSTGWGPPGDAATDIKQYLERAAALARRGFRGTAGQLAQAVQRSAFPGRYDEHRGEATALLGGAGAGGPAPLSQAPPGPPVASRGASFAQALLNPATAHDPLRLLSAIKETRAAAAAGEPRASGPMPVVEIQGHITQHARDAVDLVKHYLGTPYVWGGENPGGFDCSGLLQYVWGKEGIQIPRTSQQQWHAGRPVGQAHLQPGDAVFFGSRNGPHHVGMYIGNGQFVESPHTGSRVRISHLSGRHDFIGGRRFA